jgi:DNA-binding transcriptional LysR family regulator
VDLHQIECALAIVEQGSFTRAAETLYVSQSSLSYTIGRLERELGVSLFVRSGKAVHLTPAGEAFVPNAREALVAARAAEEAVCEVGGLMKGQLSFAVSPTLKRFAADTLADFTHRHPDVKISMSVRNPDEAVDMVRSSLVSIAIVGIDDVPAKLKSSELFEEEVVVVFPPGTEARKAVRLEELRELRLVVSRHHSQVRRTIQQQLLAQNAKIVAEADNLDALLELVLAGVGAAVMSVDGALAAVERGAVIVPLEPPRRYMVVLVQRSGRLTPVEVEFKRLARDRAQLPQRSTHPAALYAAPTR